MKKVLAVFSDHRAWKSKSPMMHNGVIRARGLQDEYIYLAFELQPQHVGEAVHGLRALGMGGANVTVPYKETVIPFIDELSSEASAVGAVNTIVVEKDGSLSGHNTDIGGFLDSLEYAEFSLKGKTVLLCGTGGASRGVLQALKQGGAAEIYLAGRNVAKTAGMAHEFGVHPLEIFSLCKSAVNPDLVINTTAVTSPQESPELCATIENLCPQNCSLVVDINYGRTENIWKDLAERCGGGFCDGLPMLAMQAARSFRLWTGLDVSGAEFCTALGV